MAFGYSKVKGLNAQIATLSTPAGGGHVGVAPVIAAARLRRGNVASAHGAAKIVGEAVAVAKAAGAHTVVVRADSAYYGAALAWIEADTSSRSSSVTPTAQRRLPAGFEHIAWIRPEEAEAVLVALGSSSHAEVRGADGQLTGRVVFVTAASPEVTRHRTQAHVQRFRRNDRPEGVAWLREDEADAVLEALQVEHDVDAADRTSRVLFYGSSSREFQEHGSPTRLVRRQVLS